MRAGKFDVICANLISNLLIAEKTRLARQLAPGGTLVVAGILAKEFREVQSAFDEIGLKLAASFVDGEWRSGAFVFSE
jgi:ribosomal protein L11 methyltransferase